MHYRGLKYETDKKGTAQTSINVAKTIGISFQMVERVFLFCRLNSVSAGGGGSENDSSN